ncbi:MAG TPA: hypothetical protein DEG76_05945 [Pseudohongiella sp.]|nr:hypothetical protein [Pseudohongiella sp.]|tara:strand:+ start:101398 stop:102336 length:939 start_codon:yes stop_codon:yes gene_type:complete
MQNDNSMPEATVTRRQVLLTLGATAGALAIGTGVTSLARPAAAASTDAAAGAIPGLTKHGLVAEELQRWQISHANQGVAVDEDHFYGIGNHALVKHRKDTGGLVSEWMGPRDGAIIHLNAGWVDGDELVVAHSNFPQLPMASSLETYDRNSLQPVATYSLGIRLGSLTWAVRHQGFWWACFANYNDNGTTPGFDQRWTHVGKFDDNWQMLESWLFPPQIVATWGDSACSGGDWGDDGLLYVTGHDAAELYVLRLPRQGVTLEYVTTIDVPFEGQSWAWDRSARGERIIYGISRARREVIVARIPELPSSLLS